MKKLFIVALALVAGASLSTIQAGKKTKKTPKNAIQLVSGSDSLSYTAGYVLADIVRERFLAGLAKEVSGTPDSLQLQLAYQGLFDALKGDTTLFKARPAEQFLNARVGAIHKAKEEKQKQAGKDFLAANATKEGVVVLPSGLQYKVLTEGNGPVAKESDKVQVKYEGRLIDGTVFDSSYQRGEPIEFPLNGVIKGWTEGLQLMPKGGKPVTFAPNQVIKGWTEALCMMPVGSKWQLYVPQELGYGSRPAGQIPAYSTLIFDIEVVGIEK